MKITWHQEYASIKLLNSPEEQLPQFVLITGENGSGKTHLLEAITSDSGNASVLDNNGNKLSCQLFNTEKLRLKNEREIAGSYSKEKEVLWFLVSNAIQAVKKTGPDIIRSETPELYSALEGDNAAMEAIFPDTDSRDKLATELNLFVDKSYALIRDSYTSEIANIISRVRNSKVVMQNNNRGVPKPKPTKEENEVAQLNEELRSENRTFVVFLEAIESKFEKPLLFLTRSDFDHVFPIDFYSNPFQRTFTSWFRRYVSRSNENSIAQVATETLGGEHGYLEADVFRQKYGYPPWDFTNELFRKAGLPFKISKPESFNLEVPFAALVVDMDTNSTIAFSSMSSGEQIIMSLAIALSYSQGADEIEGFPKLLLLDEVDAYLHPTMTNFLLNVVQDYLVKERGMHVIMTTHSPSTIAICSNEESIFYLEKEGLTKHLRQCTKDVAIAMLTSGVPTLNISHENHRWVFVESQYDAEFYTEIFQCLRRHRGPMNSFNNMVLSFHSSGGSPSDTVSGNCVLVEKHVNSLRDHGNTTISGIIDWDTKNECKGFVFVVAEEKRYNIETLLLDPLIVGALMLDRNLYKPSEFGLDNGFFASQLKSCDNAIRQNLVDAILTQIGNGKPINVDTVSCQYEGVFSLELPKWFLHEPGHHLEDMYKNGYGNLKKYHNEHEFKREVMVKVVNEYPQLLPLEFSEIFLKLAE